MQTTSEIRQPGRPQRRQGARKGRKTSAEPARALHLRANCGRVVSIFVVKDTCSPPKPSDVDLQSSNIQTPCISTCVLHTIVLATNHQCFSAISQGRNGRRLKSLEIRTQMSNAASLKRAGGSENWVTRLSATITTPGGGRGWRRAEDERGSHSISRKSAPMQPRALHAARNFWSKRRGRAWATRAKIETSSLCVAERLGSADAAATS